MKKFGLLGEKLGHSYSPKIQEIILNNLNIKGSYDLIEIERDNFNKNTLIEIFEKYDGLNVTIPYKQEVMKYLDNINPLSTRIGAVNTINFEKNGINGYNTDYNGLGYIFKHNDIEIENKEFYILGSGGASKSFIRYLLDNNARKVFVVSRNVKNDDNDVHYITYDELFNVEKSFGIINTTPVGMFPKIGVSPVSKEIISKFEISIDAIYNPPETEFLKISNKLGLKNASGIYMLIGQAIESQEIWNNIKINNETFRKIFDDVLKCFQI